ncbi:hypothetical protein [Hyphobacterium sp.]|uniref:hypothetical protein n=1 Tax=Hyphobacterium sp. TaxID=2004662 RepID=UPI00374A32D1
MTARVLRWVFAVFVGLQAAMAMAEESASVSIHEVPLSNLNNEINELGINADTGDGLLQFALAPTITPLEGRIFLGLTPESSHSAALIVIVNNTRAVRIEPADGPITAEIELPGHVLRTGTNIVSLALENDENDGWRLDGANSRLRVSFETTGQATSLGDIEAILGSDIPPVNTVYIEDRRNDVMLEAVIAQGIAMRMGRAPEFVETADGADMRFGYVIDPTLDGPELRFSGEDLDVVVAGRHQQDMETAARLFASRSIRLAEESFTVADALTSAAIGTETTRVQMDGQTLREFSQARLPFGDGRGAQTAVIITEPDGEGRLAAMSIMARTALVHGTAWIYAWYGSESDNAPEDRNMVFIGTAALSDRNLLSGAPVEFRTALRAAAERAGRRTGLRLSSAAYADDAINPAGVATVFSDPQNPTRWIAGFTSPQPQGFNRASEILSRSAHWAALSGRAALWDANGVTGYDYSVVGTPSLAERFGLPDFSMREIAALLFLLTLLFVLRGAWRRRRVHDKSRGWK